METELLAIKMSESRINDERLNRILRAAHAVGGPADFFAFVRIRELAYQTENSAALIRSRNNSSPRAQSPPPRACYEKDAD